MKTHKVASKERQNTMEPQLGARIRFLKQAAKMTGAKTSKATFNKMTSSTASDLIDQNNLGDLSKA